jgi:hypothetical protein
MSASKYMPPDWVEPNLGEGISRPRASESTRLYRMRVKQPGSPALSITLPAPSKTKAMAYCRNRWPGALVEAL